MRACLWGLHKDSGSKLYSLLMLSKNPAADIKELLFFNCLQFGLSLWNQLSKNSGQNKNTLSSLLLYSTHMVLNTLAKYVSSLWLVEIMFSMPHLISAGYCCASFLRSLTVVLHFKSEITGCLCFVVDHWVVLKNCYRNFNNESVRLYILHRQKCEIGLTYE